MGLNDLINERSYCALGRVMQIVQKKTEILYLQVVTRNEFEIHEKYGAALQNFARKSDFDLEFVSIETGEKFRVFIQNQKETMQYA